VGFRSLTMMKERPGPSKITKRKFVNRYIKRKHLPKKRRQGKEAKLGGAAQERASPACDGPKMKNDKKKAPDRGRVQEKREEGTRGKEVCPKRSNRENEEKREGNDFPPVGTGKLKSPRKKL